MRCEVGNWTYIEDGLPEVGLPVYLACRAKDGRRKDWVACGVIYGNWNHTKNVWGVPLLDFDCYEAYAWMPEWYPKPPKQKQLKG